MFITAGKTVILVNTKPLTDPYSVINLLICCTTFKAIKPAATPIKAGASMTLSLAKNLNTLPSPLATGSTIEIDFTITSNPAVITPFNISMFCAMELPVKAFDKLSKAVITLAIPLTTAVFIFLKLVAIPSEAVFAWSANPPTCLSISIILSENSLNVISPDFKASYKSFCADSPANPNDSASWFSPIPIVSVKVYQDCISTLPLLIIWVNWTSPLCASSAPAPEARNALFNASVRSVEYDKSLFIKANLEAVDTTSSSLVGSPSIPLVSFLVDDSTSSVANPKPFICFGNLFKVSYLDAASPTEADRICIPLATPAVTSPPLTIEEKRLFVFFSLFLAPAVNPLSCLLTLPNALVKLLSCADNMTLTCLSLIFPPFSYFFYSFSNFNKSPVIWYLITIDLIF